MNAMTPIGGLIGSLANAAVTAAGNAVGTQPPTGAGPNGMDSQGGSLSQSQNAGPTSERSGSGSGPGDTTIPSPPPLNADYPASSSGASSNALTGLGASCSLYPPCTCQHCPQPQDAWPLFGRQTDLERRATTLHRPALTTAPVPLFTGYQVQVARCSPTLIVFACWTSTSVEEDGADSFVYTVAAVPLSAAVSHPTPSWSFTCAGEVVGLALAPTFGVAISQNPAGGGYQS